MTDAEVYFYLAVASVAVSGILLGWVIDLHRKIKQERKAGYDEGVRDGRAIEQRATLMFDRFSPEIHVTQYSTDKVRAQVILGQYDIQSMGEVELVQYAGKLLRQKLMEEIMPYTKVEHWYDPQRCGEVFEGRLEIVRR